MGWKVTQDRLPIHEGGEYPRDHTWPLETYTLCETLKPGCPIIVKNEETIYTTDNGKKPEHMGRAFRLFCLSFTCVRLYSQTLLFCTKKEPLTTYVLPRVRRLAFYFLLFT